MAMAAPGYQPAAMWASIRAYSRSRQVASIPWLSGLTRSSTGTRVGDRARVAITLSSVQVYRVVHGKVGATLADRPREVKPAVGPMAGYTRGRGSDGIRKRVIRRSLWTYLAIK